MHHHTTEHKRPLIVALFVCLEKNGVHTLCVRFHLCPQSSTIITAVTGIIESREKHGCTTGITLRCLCNNAHEL